MSKIILLSGGKGCGKTVVARMLQSKYNAVDASCKLHLYTLTQKLFNVSDERFFEIYENRDLKEVPLKEFTVTLEAWIKLVMYLDYSSGTYWGRLCAEGVQLSIREAMIYVSEIICKPLFGDDYFGKVRADNLQEQGLYYEDSCGFQRECDSLIDKVGVDNILLIRVRGRGDFEGDSRSFVTLKDDRITQVDIENTGTLASFTSTVDDIVALWLDR